MDEKEEIIRKVRKEVGKQKNIIDKKRKRYPEFLFQRHRSVIPEIVDYKQLILEFDDNFTIKEFYKIKRLWKGINYSSMLLFQKNIVGSGIFILMDKYLGKYYQYNLYDFRVKI